MIRSDVLKALLPLISDQLLVTNIGLPSQEMHLLDDQPSNFYMLGTMGLASSIGLGLALAQDKEVIALVGVGAGALSECILGLLHGGNHSACASIGITVGGIYFINKVHGYTFQKKVKDDVKSFGNNIKRLLD